MIDELTNMIEELQCYKHDKTELMQNYIVARLDLSFFQYNNELSKSVEFLTHKHEKSLLKRLTKLNEKTD